MMTKEQEAEWRRRLATGDTKDARPMTEEQKKHRKRLRKSNPVLYGSRKKMRERMERGLALIRSWHSNSEADKKHESKRAVKTVTPAAYRSKKVSSKTK